MKAKSSPDATPEFQNKLGWYWSELGGGWYKTMETLEKEKRERTAKLDSIIEEESNTIYLEEEARIRAQLHEVMNQKFAANRMQLGSNLVLRNSSKVDIATSNDDAIDLITQSTASLQRSQPTVIPGSRISLAITSTLTGNVTGFLQLSSGSHPSSPLQPFAAMHWKPKEPPCFFGHSSEDVHTWTSLVRHCLTFMGVVMPNRLRIR